MTNDSVCAIRKERLKRPVPKCILILGGRKTFFFSARPFSLLVHKRGEGEGEGREESTGRGEEGGRGGAAPLYRNLRQGSDCMHELEAFPDHVEPRRMCAVEVRPSPRPPYRPFRPDRGAPASSPRRTPRLFCAPATIRTFIRLLPEQSTKLPGKREERRGREEGGGRMSLSSPLRTTVVQANTVRTTYILFLFPTYACTAALYGACMFDKHAVKKK